MSFQELLRVWRERGCAPHKAQMGEEVVFQARGCPMAQGTGSSLWDRPETEWHGHLPTRWPCPVHRLEAEPCEMGSCQDPP